MAVLEVRVPDLGNFAEVPVIDVLVQAGEVVEAESPLVTLETDKASMDVPSPYAGKVVEVSVQKGVKVSKGTLIAKIEANVASTAATPARPAPAPPAATATTPAPSSRPWPAR